MELHVRNLPPSLHRRLQEQARAEGRSMSAEAVAILGAALESGADARAKRQGTAIRRLADIRARNRLPAGAEAAEHLVRADRDIER